MGTLADSLFNLLMGWVRALVNAIWALFTTDHTTLLEFLGKNWVLIVVVILAAGLAIDWLVWLIRWRPYHLWARRARRFLRMPEPEQEEKRKKRAPSGDETQKMPAAYAQTDSGAPEEEEEQWLPLQQPQMDERQAQEVMQRAQSVPDEELGAYPGMRYGAKAAEGMAETQRYSAVRAEGPGAAEVERRRAEIDAWQQQMQEEARQKAEAERQRIAQQKAYEAEQQRVAQQKAYGAEQQRVAQQKAYEAEQQRIAQQKAYEEAQRQKAQAEYQRQLAEYERQKAQYEQDMARYRQEKAAYDAEMARRAAQSDETAQSDEAAQADAQTAPRRRRAPQQKPRTYSDYVSGETVERLPDPPQWPQVQQAAEAAKKPKKGLVSRVAKMMEEDDGNEIAGINALPPRVSKDEAYHPAKTPQKNGKRKR